MPRLFRGWIARLANDVLIGPTRRSRGGGRRPGNHGFPFHGRNTVIDHSGIRSIDDLGGIEIASIFQSRLDARREEKGAHRASEVEG